MYLLNDKQAIEIEGTTFSDLNLRESDVEEILRQNIDMICGDEESLLIVGEQVINSANARSDLTAVDNLGNLVLIEVKRDKRDIAARREAFEFQAIRYAASCATIKTREELEQKLFISYVEKHRNEYGKYPPDLTDAEVARLVLREFWDMNGIESFNAEQRIILVASEFDKQTPSAVAWLISKGVKISCYEVRPHRYEEQVFIEVKRILPVLNNEDYYVEFPDRESRSRDRAIVRRSLPKINDLLDLGIVKPDDIIVAKDKNEKATLLANGNVRLESGEETSLQKWLKGVYGWPSVQTYNFAIQESSGKSLSQLRSEYMETHTEE